MRYLLFTIAMLAFLVGPWAACAQDLPAPPAPPAPPTMDSGPAAPAPETPASPAPAPIAGPAETVSVFKGDDPTADGISLGSWGSGGAAKSQEQRLEGAWSIKLTTQGLYSGGKIEFAQPPALVSGNDAHRYLQFSFMFRETEIVNPAAGTEVTWADIEPYQKPKASKMRFVFVSDAGASVEVQEPTGAIDPDDGWMRLAVPVTKLKASPAATEFRLKRLLVFTDVPCSGMTSSGQDTSLYLGAMRLMTDTAPIKVDPIDERTVAIMDPQYFAATADGGVSSLKYSWDFDETNGIQTDSTDRIARTVYSKGGVYTVTLTVSDADGIKAPVTVKTKIEVTD